MDEDYSQNNEHLQTLHRAIGANDPKWAKEAVGRAVEHPHLLPWIKRMIAHYGPRLSMEVRHVLQEAIAAEEGTLETSGAKGGETSPAPTEEGSRRRQSP